MEHGAWGIEEPASTQESKFSELEDSRAFEYSKMQAVEASVRIRLSF
jgi:hypothetical protein